MRAPAQSLVPSPAEVRQTTSPSVSRIIQAAEDRRDVKKLETARMKSDRRIQTARTSWRRAEVSYERRMEGLNDGQRPADPGPSRRPRCRGSGHPGPRRQVQAKATHWVHGGNWQGGHGRPGRLRILGRGRSAPPGPPGRHVRCPRPVRRGARVRMSSGFVTESSRHAIYERDVEVRNQRPPDMDPTGSIAECEPWPGPSGAPTIGEGTGQRPG